MFKNYKLALLDFYRIKKENHRLSVNLEEPGREKIRNECVKVFLVKKTQKDKDLIKLVFDPTNKYEDQVRSIEQFEVDRFRPLVKFLTKGTGIREEKFVKLIAWLIDFPAYNEWRELSEEELKVIFENAAKKPEEENIGEETKGSSIPEPIGDVKVHDIISAPPPPIVVIIDKPTGESNGEDTKQPVQPKGPVYIPKFSPHYITISCIVLLLAGTTSFAIWERSTTTVKMPEKGEKFMYWDGDHYEPIGDKNQNVGAAIIPLNIQTLTQQRKITLPDTLTKSSLGKVWYKGYGKDHEFFTFSGAYPSDTSRILKPLSDNIRIKYTSNYRYLLTRLVWFLCAAFFIGLCGYAVSTVKKVDKSKEEKNPEINSAPEITHEVNGTESPQCVMPA